MAKTNQSGIRMSGRLSADKSAERIMGEVDGFSLWHLPIKPTTRDQRIVGQWLGMDVVVDNSLPPNTAQLVDKATGKVKATVRTEPVK